MQSRSSFDPRRGPETTCAGQATDPEPQGNQVLVRIIAAEINPHDQKGRDRGLLVEKCLPHAILANDISGIVDKVGLEVKRFSVGDRIFGQSNILSGGPDQAGLQRFCILDADFAAPIPSHLSFDEAATFPVNAMRVSLLYSVHRAIVIIGGASNSSNFALQFVHLVGFGKIITTAKIRKDGGQSLRDLGATHVIDREAADVEDRIRAIVGDELPYAFDTVNGSYSGGVSHQLALSLLSTTKKGSLATLVRGEADPTIAASKKAGFRKDQVLGVSDLHKELASMFWDMIPGWVEKGQLKPLVSR
ncbi:chaperonin 10-like protein [Aspergillus parasiticus]|uniref:Chaperonin 10-like protein n=1 Tax=Aspergillus parasiticus TaxID=5067 RepID=A0A5N6DAC4_ASPPA|nr:chaperonin 10-like protein [Aspergillus parasiticus]